ncbi:MAG: Asp-tRNA(Asn)/Glu-tRNA(Gln) amidotransferase subunit GatC [Candidatus Omnitrophota bacterium]
MDVDINYVARLARIELSDEQKRKLGKQLSDILQYITKLQQLDVANVEPMSHVLPVQNVFRPDVVSPALPIDKVLANAPAATKEGFVVPKVIE